MYIIRRVSHHCYDLGAQVAEWLARQPPTIASRVRFPAGDLIPAPLVRMAFFLSELSSVLGWGR